MTLAIAHLCRPAAGERNPGDAVVVREVDGATLLAVIDVLGHGDEAARVAGLAVAYLREAPLTRSSAVVHGVHQALRGTRGAALAVCVIRGLALDACGVGNVDTHVLGSKLPIVNTPGIVGQRYGALRELTGTLQVGDRLVCHSDGISSRVPLRELRHLSPADACAAIMTHHRRSYDDATVLIADVGAPAR